MNLVRRSTLVAGVATAATFFGLVAAPPAGAVIVPKVTAVTPNTGYTAGGARVTVSGSGFSGVAAVYFGATKGTAITVLSTGKLTVTAPAHVDGPVDVRVKTTAAESAIVAADHYTYKPTPVSAVSTLGVTDSSVALSWVNPKDPYLGQIVIRHSAAGSTTPPTPTTGVAVATLPKTATSATSTGLVAGTTYAFAVFARDADGHYAVAASRVARTIAWGASASTDPSHGFPTAISCVPGSTNCALVDQLGSAMTFAGSWVNPQKLSLDKALTSVSCVSSTWCFAVGLSGFTAIFDPTLASAPDIRETGQTFNFTGVSCVTTTFCVMTDDAGGVSLYNGPTGSRAVVDSTPGGVMTAVSCVTTSFCKAVDNSGDVYTYTGTWSAALPVTLADLASIACPSISMCVAITDQQSSEVYNGSSWSAATVNAILSPGPVSCASSTFCMTSDIFGNTEIYNGTSWGSTGQMCAGSSNCGLAITGLSCPISGNCIAVDSNTGGYLTYSTGSWNPDVLAGDTTNFVTGLACPSSSFCMLTDEAGVAYQYGGTTWDSGVQASSRFGSVSCPVAGSCEAIADNGAARFASGAWGAATDIEGIGNAAAVNDISCAASVFCAAVDAKGRVAFTDGTRWSSFGTIDPDELRAISCSTLKLCVAVDTAGRLLNFNGSTWSNPTYADMYNHVTDVQCIGSSFCAAVDDAGNALYFNGSTWSALSSIAGNSGLLSLSCISTRFCYATTTTTVVGFGPGLAAVPAILPSHGYATQISCDAAPICMVADTAGDTIKAA